MSDEGGAAGFPSSAAPLASPEGTERYRMTGSTRSWRLLVPVFALLLAGVGFVAFAVGMTSTPSSTTLAASSTVPGHPELGTGWTSVAGFRSGGAGGMQITITAINGSNLTLQTTDGWTRTIDASGATITRAGQTISVADLKVGDTITFRESRQSNGSYKITSIAVVLPSVSGTVTAVGASSVTVRLADGSSKTIQVAGSTVYEQAGKTVSKSAVATGVRIVAEGTTDSAGTFTAATVQIQPATITGTVKSKTSTTIVVTTADGSTVTVDVNSSTTYRIRGQSSASLSNVAVGDRIAVSGTYGSNGSITATTVVAGSNSQPGFGAGMGGFGGGMGHGFGRGMGGFGDLPAPGSSTTPGASAAPNSSGI